MMFPIDLVDFVTKGRFGTFTRDTNRDTVLATLGPSDHWVTYPGIYGYGCVGFEIVDDDVSDPQFRLSVSFAFQHAEHFHLPYESWRENAEHSWKKMLYDWPDSRFDVNLGPFRSGARLDDLYDQFLSHAYEVQFDDPGPKPTWRSFDMPCGVQVEFSNRGAGDVYTLLRLQTMRRWGPDVGPICYDTKTEQ
jgi:hypothetical protein